MRSHKNNFVRNLFAHSSPILLEKEDRYVFNIGTYTGDLNLRRVKAEEVGRHIFVIIQTSNAKDDYLVIPICPNWHGFAALYDIVMHDSLALRINGELIILPLGASHFVFAEALHKIVWHETQKTFLEGCFYCKLKKGADQQILTKSKSLI
jgi:hypothetical protein